MRQIRFRRENGTAVAINSHAVQYVAERQDDKNLTVISFGADQVVAVQGSFEEIARRVFADADDENAIPL